MLAISAGLPWRVVRIAYVANVVPPPTQSTAASTWPVLNHSYQVSASGMGAGQ